MKSSDRDLFLWIDDPPPAGCALHFASTSWTWEVRAYEEIARLALQMTDGLLHFGSRRNDVIVIVSPPGPQFVIALFGIMLAGATPSVVAPPRAFQNQVDYDSHFLRIVETAAPRMILASAELAPSLAAVSGQKFQIRTFDEVLAAGASVNAAPRAARADLALLQFTAGSSGQVRGVRVPYSALEANVSAIRRWLEWSHEDAAAFWIPQYHDMGLIGGIFAPLVSQCDLWLLTPEQFVRRPLEYLRCFGERGARLTALPSFGLDYMVRRVRSKDLSGMDFSAVKGFIVGAELINPSTLTRFYELLEPFGLPRSALLPAYGLAEATLAVSGVSLGRIWTALSPAGGGPPVVSCGSPLSDVEVTILDEQSQPVSEGHVGEIVIRGVSVASGYHTSQSSDSLTTFEETVLRSGDAGFLSNGQLFPIGRLGDSIKIRGRALFAELLEGELNKLGYLREHNAVLLGMRGGRSTVLWVAERIGSPDPDEALKMLSRLAEGADVSLVQAGRGAIPRTSSGKPRRRLLWHAFINGQLSGKVRSYSRSG